MDEDDRERRVRAHIRAQARACARLGSPFTAKLLCTLANRLDMSTELGRAVLSWRGDPGEDALGLRLAAALHALSLKQRTAALHEVRTERLEDCLVEILGDHQAFIRDFIGHPPQTNEVARAAVLTPGFLTIAGLTGLPLEFYEIGSSAGLNQLWHRWHYRLGDLAWGDPSAPISLQPAWQGKSLAAAGIVKTARIARAAARGCDIRPIDLADEDERVRLAAYLWPDQQERLDRLRTAIDIARQNPPSSEQADAGDWLDRQLKHASPDRCAVIFHSVVWQYLPDSTKWRCIQAIQAAARRGIATAWLRMEPEPSRKYCRLDLDLIHLGQTHHLADSHFHGAWVSWHGPGGP